MFSQTCTSFLIVAYLDPLSTQLSDYISLDIKSQVNIFNIWYLYLILTYVLLCVVNIKSQVNIFNSLISVFDSLMFVFNSLISVFNSYLCFVVWMDIKSQVNIFISYLYLIVAYVLLCVVHILLINLFYESQMLHSLL